MTRIRSPTSKRNGLYDRPPRLLEYLDLVIPMQAIADWTLDTIPKITQSTLEKKARLTASRRRKKTCQRAEKHDLTKSPSKKPQEISEKNQEESHFFKLPPELRHQIYDYLYPYPQDICVHDLLIGGRYQLVGLNRRSTLEIRDPYIYACYDCTCENLHTSSLALPLTCRQLYRETISYYYRKNRFHFMEFQLILSLPTVIPAKHLRSVTSLHLSFRVDDLVRNLGLEAPALFERRYLSVSPPPASKRSVARQRRQWIDLWRLLANTLVDIQTLILNFHRRCRSVWEVELKACEWLLDPLLLFQRGEGEGEGYGNGYLMEFEIRFGRDWEQFVPDVREALAAKAGEKGVPFKLERASECESN